MTGLISCGICMLSIVDRTYIFVETDFLLPRMTTEIYTCLSFRSSIQVYLLHSPSHDSLFVVPDSRQRTVHVCQASLSCWKRYDVK